MTAQISVVICTYNRAAYLRKALQGLVEQTLPRSEYEVLVVDNAPADDTWTVVKEFAARAPVRYLGEPALGANRARNTGWRNAAGYFVAFQDDDVIAAPRWLENILYAFDTVQPRPGCIGGKVEPIWEAPRPDWLSDELALSLALLDLSPKPLFLDGRQLMVSANLAFPRAVLEELGGFEVFLGRRGGNLLSMDENLLQKRLLVRGLTCYYDPAVAVRHHVSAARLTRHWFRRRLYWEGVSLAVAQAHLASWTKGRRLAAALSTAGVLFRSPRDWYHLLRRNGGPDLFTRHCQTWAKLGYLAGLVTG